jgi:hypothetical protein
MIMLANIDNSLRTSSCMAFVQLSHLIFTTTLVISRRTQWHLQQKQGTSCCILDKYIRILTFINVFRVMKVYSVRKEVV